MNSNISLLVVDDDVNYAVTLSKIMDKKGYITATAESGFRAIDLIKERAFDVVLMDIRMPVMNGLEAFRKIKEIRPDTIVILMTAFSVDDLIRDALKEGAYAVIRKPFDIDTVVNMIEKAKTGILLAVVDDDPQICQSLKNVLEKKGYSVTPCATGEEAISLAKDRKFDIYLIDMKLPVLNGLETYLEIKKTNEKAIAIMMTGYRQELDDLVKQSKEKGAYACLYKPFQMDDVIKMIDEISKQISR
jgi:two-component system response regulator HydG